MPRGQYTSGKGSSAVGLTAYITRDPETRQLVLQTYVYVCGSDCYVHTCNSCTMIRMNFAKHISNTISASEN